MFSGILLAFLVTVSCFALSNAVNEATTLPDVTHIYPATVFDATQQICSHQDRRQGILSGIKHASHSIILSTLSKSIPNMIMYCAHNIILLYIAGLWFLNLLYILFQTEVNAWQLYCSIIFIDPYTAATRLLPTYFTL